MIYLGTSTSYKDHSPEDQDIRVFMNNTVQAENKQF